MPPPAAVPGPRYEALLQLLRTSEALWESSRVFFASWDLSPSQFNVLNLLHDRKDGMSQTELSRELIMHRSNATGLIDRLEKRGLVIRRADPADRRIHKVGLTTQGRALMRKIYPRYYQAAEAVLGHLTPKHAEQLAASLNQISANASTLINEMKNK
jgi:DNA-binding MarR family transcriptional regulator